jgi:uncharacterized heparinase superfamily protein
MSAKTLAGSEIVSRLARGSLLSRLAAKRQPLKLVAVPRDHVAGDRQRGAQILAGRLPIGSEVIPLADLDFGAISPSSKLGESLQGFSWLRDLAAAASRERGSPIGEALAARWLIAHGPRADAAWAPHLWGERILFWSAYAPFILSSSDSGYRSALLNTLARGARHLDSTADKAPLGLKRVTAWCGVIAAGLLVQGGVSRVARGESGLARALGAAQFDDGGLVSRSPYEQVLLVDRLSLLRSCYLAARQTIPEQIETAAAAALAALHGVTLGDGALSSWQGCGPGEAARLMALIEGCGLSALGTVVVLDAAPPPQSKMAQYGSASTLAFEMSDGGQRLVVNCGGPGPLPTALPRDLVDALRSTAAHSTLILADANSTSLQADGSLGRGVEDVAIDRLEDNDSSRLEASHDGYVKGFGMVHKRALVLGNDGKEVRGVDQMVPKGRKKIRGAAPYAVRFHLAPGVEATLTADGMGALIRSKGAPPWNFRCRGGELSTEESLWIDGRGQARRTIQLAVTGEISAMGGEIGWQFRRAS